MCAHFFFFFLPFALLQCFDRCRFHSRFDPGCAGRIRWFCFSENLFFFRPDLLLIQLPPVLFVSGFLLFALLYHLAGRRKRREKKKDDVISSAPSFFANRSSEKKRWRDKWSLMDFLFCSRTGLFRRRRKKQKQPDVLHFSGQGTRGVVRRTFWVG